ncbi:Alcohol dehydrogenase GroES-like domain protein [Mycobacterium marinum]|uniref:alcohol dehydrogenase catalytic domain-containing protein n=1 Tax=Mycobacterium marinum TaxID=1781 RepID=UPI000E3DD1CB|nr:alcohol dehydrogenase catalytic domain-containing protein [Mycobacterium marinum]RFZ49365.1 Alcohol dehydrogenase GroES-like domain protein [Mycobacterium marinum]
MTDNGYRALVRRPAGPDGCSLVDVAVLDTPALEPGDLLLAPLVAGICGTDWQILRGDRPDDSPVLGHEGIARVVVGSKAFAPGDIVTVNPTHPTDPGFLLGHNVAGLWAERTRIPASVVNAGLVVSVPSSAANDVLIGALAEPLASAIYGLEIAMAVFEDTPRSLVVWGDGIVGQLAAAVWRQAMPETEQLIVGRNRDSHNCIAADDPDLPSRLAALRGPVSAVLATPRSATVTALTTLDNHIDHALTVDVHGGLDSGPVSLRSGEVDVAAVRAANCGGLSSVPVAKTLQRAGAGPLRLFGHRGVSNAHLRAAIGALTENAATFASLLTQVTDLEGAAELINGVLQSGNRCHDGRRVLKAAIRLEGAAA